MQEIPNAQWDIHEAGPLPVFTRLYVLFLVACCIWAIAVIIKALWNTRSWSSTRHGNLIALSKALQAAGAPQASTLASDIPEDSPEAGFRRLTALKSMAFHELPADLIARADLRFTYVLSALRASVTNLKYLATLLLILTGAWTTYGLAYDLKGIASEKVTGLSAIIGGVQDMLPVLYFAFLLLAAVHLIYWRPSVLLIRRESLWLQLKGYLQLLLTRAR